MGNGIAKNFFWSYFPCYCYDKVARGMLIEARGNPQPLVPSDTPVCRISGHKRVVSDSPGLVDFAIRLVIFVLNLPDGQLLFWGEIQITEEL